MSAKKKRNETTTVDVCVRLGGPAAHGREVWQ